jgi:hypothetical protein
LISHISSQYANLLQKGEIKQAQNEKSLLLFVVFIALSICMSSAKVGHIGLIEI